MVLKKLAPEAEPLGNAMFNSTNRALPLLKVSWALAGAFFEQLDSGHIVSAMII